MIFPLRLTEPPEIYPPHFGSFKDLFGTDTAGREKILVGIALLRFGDVSSVEKFQVFLRESAASAFRHIVGALHEPVLGRSSQCYSVEIVNLPGAADSRRKTWNFST